MVPHRGTQTRWALWSGAGTAAAAFIFFAAAARARIVAAGLTRRRFRVGGADDLHQLLARLAGFHQLGEFLEIGFAVGEKAFQSGAEIVEPLFAVRRFDDAVLGTAAVAHAEHFALAAILRQAGPFLLAEFALLRILDHLSERAVVDVAYFIFTQNMEVARIKVAALTHHGHF